MRRGAGSVLPTSVVPAIERRILVAGDPISLHAFLALQLAFVGGVLVLWFVMLSAAPSGLHGVGSQQEHLNLAPQGRKSATIHRSACPFGGAATLGRWRMTSPRDAVATAERRAMLLPGTDERFSGWGVMGLPFASEDVFAMRRFPASSIGPGYSSVWHRLPNGAWTFYSDVAPDRACARFFGSAVARTIKCPITVEWTGPAELHVEVPEGGLSCDLTVGPTLASRAMNAMAALMPEPAWRSPRVLSLMAALAGPMLGAGRLSMAGAAPNRQTFIANPRKVWVVTAATLRSGERLADQPGPVHPQAQLGDFRIPQRGILAIGNARFESLDPTRHSTAMTTAV